MFNGGNTDGSNGRRVTAAVLLACVAGVPAAAAAQVTPAGTRISNTAVLTHAGEPGTAAINSNTVVTRVDAVVDVTVTPAVASRTVASTGDGVSVAFVVTNTGNWTQAFTLAGSNGSPLPTATDADGRERAGEVTLAPGEQRMIFVLQPGSVGNRTIVTLTATAATGTGAHGAVLSGAGPDGGDAVLGASGGQASAQTVLLVDALAPSLTKSQTVRAPDGSERATNGSVITYELVARFPAATRGVVVSDAVPAGTRFVPGSVTLDGRVLSDAADEDAAQFDGTAVRVTLGDAAAATVRTIRFQTIIN
jgi:uncharacterized repeat protein (TIGR01451 family)